LKTITKNFWSELSKPFLVLAPMENVTDYVFREVVSLYLPRPDVMMTEFTNVDALTSSGFDKTIHRFKFSETQRPIVAQIWGTNPENFYKSAKLISDLGFDGIDINMGCPIKDIIKNGACSALINNPKLATEIIKACKKGAPKLPISVKTRIGFNKVATDEWISFLLEQDLSALTVHGRTAKQMSDVVADWNEIKKAVDLKSKIAPKTLLIGNGDINSYTEAVNAHKDFGVDGIMIARGILKNPFVFSKTGITPTPKILSEILIKHLDLYEDFYKGDRQYDVMKKYFKMYINGFPGANQLRIELMNTKDIKMAKSLLVSKI
jgi:nifR3 family TIM-barrel protein